MNYSALHVKLFWQDNETNLSYWTSRGFAINYFRAPVLWGLACWLRRWANRIRICPWYLKLAGSSRCSRGLLLRCFWSAISALWHPDEWRAMHESNGMSVIARYRHASNKTVGHKSHKNKEVSTWLKGKQKNKNNKSKWHVNHDQIKNMRLYSV